MYSNDASTPLAWSGWKSSVSRKPTQSLPPYLHPYHKVQVTTFCKSRRFSGYLVSMGLLSDAAEFKTRDNFKRETYQPREVHNIGQPCVEVDISVVEQRYT